MEEIWKEYHRSYFYGKNKICKIAEVSNYGRIKVNGELIELKHYRTTKYLGAPFATTLHRLVAKMFIPNPDNKPCVDHIDGDKYNNNVNNLRWTTYKENNNNPITKKRMSISQREYFKTHDGTFKNRTHTDESKKKMSEVRKGIPRKTPIWNKGLKGWMTEETKEKSRKSLYITLANRTEEQKQIISKKLSENAKGNTNARNRIHINNGVKSKMVYPEELEQYINNGWTRGRIYIKTK